MSFIQKNTATTALTKSRPFTLANRFFTKRVTEEQKLNFKYSMIITQHTLQVHGTRRIPRFAYGDVKTTYTEASIAQSNHDSRTDADCESIPIMWECNVNTKQLTNILFTFDRHYDVARHPPPHTWNFSKGKKVLLTNSILTTY